MTADRYAQCDATCTVDCGACKGAGRPVDAIDPALLETVARAIFGFLPAISYNLRMALARDAAAAAITAYRGQVGATCGDVAPTIVPGPRLMCELPHGHGGAHQHDNGDGLPPTRWIAAQDGGADGRECDRCDGTGEQPDPDPHDERFYRCTVCNGSGIAPLLQEKDGGAEEAVRRVEALADELEPPHDARPEDRWDRGYVAAHREIVARLRAALATQAGDER